MPTQDKKYIRLTHQLARESAKKGFDAFGALLVLDDEIKATSIDKCIAYSDPTAHAELVLISEYCRENKLIDLEGYTLYTHVEPCVMCSGAIHWAKISRVVFSVSQEMLQGVSGGKKKPTCEELINTGNKKTEIIGPILAEEGMRVFRDFPFQSKKERHRQYHKIVKLD